MTDLDLKYRPVALIILDGWGVPDDPEVSAEARAHTPFYDSLIINYPNTTIKCSGEDVGLPEGQMGNSEVGHLNIGAGRVVYQDYTRINRAVRLGELEANPVLVDAMEKAKASSRTLHLMGLLSDGGVHSDISHVYALLKMAAERGLADILIHAFMDGRDTPPASGLGYMENLLGFMDKEGIGDIARVGTVSGRFYAMDRDNRWDRVKKAHDAIVTGEGSRFESPLEAIGSAYDNGETDEFITPSIAGDYSGMKDGDSVIFFNFRTDRTRELTRAIALDGFDGFERPERPKLSSFVCMTEYDKTFDLPVAFPPQRLGNILGELVSRLGLRQLRIAETEKYAHVTFFFNGGQETPFDGEDRCLIPSPKDVATYNLKPQMSAFEVTDEVIKRVQSGAYDVIIMNYANPDMVGHTGIMDAAVKACEAVDLCLSRVIPEILGAGGIAFITADHGNAEKMVDPETGGPFTAHTSSEVPFIATDKGLRLREGGMLADIAPTILDIMGIAKPSEMTGESLVLK